MTTETFINVQGTLVNANLQPSQSELQDAFKLNSKGKIVIDMTLAKDVARNMIRSERQAEFAKNDVATISAMQRNNSEALEASRVRGEYLRNLTSDPRIEAAKTPDELLAVVDTISEELKA